MEEPAVFYPPLPVEPKLQFLLAITSEEDLGGEKKFDLNAFVTGEEAFKKGIERPYAIGSSKGKIYVVDRMFKRVIALDLEEHTFSLLNNGRLGAMANPSGIWISADDQKYVADMTRKQVVLLDRDDSFLQAYGGKDLMEKPVDVTVHSERVYISDLEKNQVFAFDRESGKLLQTIGQGGGEEGTFYKPSHVAVGRQGYLHVTDAFNFRVQVFDTDGNFLRAIGSLGDAIGSFARPKGIAVDRSGFLYVVDAAFDNVQIFNNETGELLLFFGGPGGAPGSMWLPAGIHIDYENVEYFSEYIDEDFEVEYLVYVANMYGPQKLNVYGFGRWIGPELSE